MHNIDNIKRWCDQYFEKTSVRIFPHTAPLDLIVNELIGRVEKLEKAQEKKVRGKK